MDLQQLFAERIGGAAFGQSTEIYKFEKIKRAKAAAREARPGRRAAGLRGGGAGPDGARSRSAKP